MEKELESFYGKLSWTHTVDHQSPAIFKNEAELSECTFQKLQLQLPSENTQTVVPFPSCVYKSTAYPSFIFHTCVLSFKGFYGCWATYLFFNIILLSINLFFLQQDPIWCKTIKLTYNKMSIACKKNDEAYPDYPSFIR